MKYLLDTCVLSEIRKPNGNRKVKETVQNIPDDQLFISVISIGEIIKGIDLLESGKKKYALQFWIQTLVAEYEQCVLEWDVETAKIWGNLTALAQKNGKSLPVSDGLIAATAKRYGLQIMTRNVADFAETGVAIINPWDE